MPLGKRDVGFYALFLGVALLVFLGRWRGCSPVVNLGYDAGNVASVAARCDYPENFPRPFPKVGPFCRYPHFAMVQILRLVEDAVGDFGTATVALHLPLVFLQLVGFYWLGWEVWRYRVASALFALVHIPLVWVHFPEGTFWGIYDDPWARNLHQAVLPFFWWAAFRYRHRPQVWPLLLGLSGLSTVLHYRSGAVWTLALWLGFLTLAWYRRREQPQVIKAVLWATGIFALFVMTLGILVAYSRFQTWEGLFTNAHVSEAYIERLYQRYTSEAWAMPWLFGLYWLIPLRFAVLWMAVVGAGWLFHTGGSQKREILVMLGAWVVAIGAFSFGLGMVSPRVSAAIYTAYVIRGLRYLIPLALFLAFWFLMQARSLSRETWNRLPTRCKLTATLGLLFPWWLLVLLPLSRFVHNRTLVTRIVNTIAVYYTPPQETLAWVRAYLVKAVTIALDWLLVEQMALITALILAWLWWKYRPTTEGWIRLTARLAQMALPVLVLLWYANHATQGGAFLMKEGARFLLRGTPSCETPQRLAYAYAVPTFVPPKERVFTPIPYPWAISYVGLREIRGGVALRPKTKSIRSDVADPKARWKEWLKLAHAWKATYMLTDDIPVDIVAASPEVELLWGQDTWALVRLRKAK